MIFNRFSVAALALLGMSSPAWAAGFTMDFDGPNDLGIAIAPGVPGQGAGSAVLGYYDNDPTYNRAGAQAWDTTFSPNALAIGSKQASNGQGNFATAYSGSFAVGSVSISNPSFDFVVADGLYISTMSLWYNIQPGSGASLEFFAGGNSTGGLSLNECSVGGADTFCGWTLLPPDKLESSLAGNLITRVVFNSAPSTAVFDDVSVTTAPIPEPSTYALMLLGLAAVGTLARRRAR